MLQIEPAPPQDWPLWRALDSHLSEEAFCRAAQGQMTRWIKTDGGIVGILRYQLFWETIPFLTLLLLKEAHRRQGFGRAIRTETDTCAVAMLDPRAARGRRYFQSMVEALPEMPVTGSLRAVEQFYRDRKGAGYFRLPNAG